MKKLNISLMLLPLVGTTLYAFNSHACSQGHAGQHNPHCVAKPVVTGTQQSGIVDTYGSKPTPSTTNPHTGSVDPDHHNTQIVVTGTYGSAPSGYSPVATATYGKGPTGTSGVVTGTPGATLTGFSKAPIAQKIPPQPVPYLAPPQPKPQAPTVYKVPPQPTPQIPTPVTVLKPTYGPGPSGISGTSHGPVTIVTAHYNKGPLGYSPITIVRPHYTKGPSGFSPVTAVTATYGPGPSGTSGVVTGTYMKGPSGYHPVTVVTPHYVKGPSGYAPATGITTHYAKGPSGYSPVTVVTPHHTKGPSGYSPVYTKSPSGYHKVYHKGPSGYRPVTAVTPTYIKGTSGHHPVTAVTHPSNIPAVTTLTHTGVTTTTGQIVPKSKPTHHFTTVNGHKPKPITSGRYSLKEGYGFNIIEPGIQNKEVAVYRSSDARQIRYKDTIEIDNSGGFLLIDHGTRNPDYIR